MAFMTAMTECISGCNLATLAVNRAFWERRARLLVARCSTTERIKVMQNKREPKRRVVVVWVALLIVGVGVDSLQAFDIPHVGSGFPGVLRTTGDLLLIRQPTGFEVFFLENPAEPEFMARYSDARKTSDFEVTGNMVVLIDSYDLSDGQLIVVSIDEPGYPIEVSRLGIGTSGHKAVGVEPSGAWTADGDAGSLHHIDLSDPANPVEIGFHHDVQARDVLRWRDYLLVGAGRFEVRESGANGDLGVVSSVMLRGGARGVAVSGDVAIVQELQIQVTPTWNSIWSISLLDLTDPTHPVVINEWPETVNDRFVDVDFGCRRAVIASSERGIAFPSIAPPYPLGDLDFVPLSSPPVGLTTFDRYAYVLTEDGRLNVLEVPGCRAATYKPDVDDRR
jgi:hypothetical protein